MSCHSCRAKYLGKIAATAPKVGTLENAAKVYQKGCLNINDREHLTVIVNSKAISIESKGGLLCMFPIKNTLFCATYKKIPQVVAFNYLSAADPAVIECHALYMDSALEAQEFVEAITAAFNTAYRTKLNYDTCSIGSEAQSRNSSSASFDGSIGDDDVKKDPWIGKITEVFKVFSRMKLRQ